VPTAGADASTPIRVALCDDEGIVRAAIRALIAREPDMVLVGEGDDGTDAVHLAHALHPDVLVVDLTMPRLDGIAVARRVAERYPAVRVLVLSATDDPLYAAKAYDEGAAGYLPLGVGPAALLAAIRAVHAGAGFVAPRSLRPFVPVGPPHPDRFHEEPLGRPLTQREEQVLALIARGETTEDLARLLGISDKTVKLHRVHLRHKLGLRTRRELTEYAIAQHLV
jgi:DNA-binding NarL/FixJ family response regulator